MDIVTKKVLTIVGQVSIIIHHKRYNLHRYPPLGNDSDAMQRIIFGRARSNPPAILWVVR